MIIEKLQVLPTLTAVLKLVQEYVLSTLHMHFAKDLHILVKEGEDLRGSLKSRKDFGSGSSWKMWRISIALPTCLAPRIATSSGT